MTRNGLLKRDLPWFAEIQRSSAGIHRPPAQYSPGPQTTPHPPQFDGSS
jgi:hypothetical protein